MGKSQQNCDGPWLVLLSVSGGGMTVIWVRSVPYFKLVTC